MPPKVVPVAGETLAMVGTGTTYVNALAFVAVPPAVVTATLLAPAVPAGVFAVIEVAVATILVAATPFTLTLVVPVKLVPVMVNAVPPKVVPVAGETLAMVGAGTTYVNALALLAVPPAVVTATLLAPAIPAGDLAVMEVAVATTLVAATPFTLTLVVPVKLVPLMVNAVPPKVVPEAGDTSAMVGTGTK